MAALLQFLGFRHEKVWRQYDTIAYDIHLVALEYA